MEKALRNMQRYQLIPAGGSPMPTTQSIAQAFDVDADFSRAGAWSGITELVTPAYLYLRAQGRQDIIDTHNYGLYMLLPNYRDVITLKYASLTDTAQGSERTRNFPLDRAYRIVHSIVSLILAWKTSAAPDAQWTVTVSSMDRAEHLARRFFHELARRARRQGMTVFVTLASDCNPTTIIQPEFSLVPATAPVGAVETAHTPDSGVLDAGDSDDDATQNNMDVWEKTYPRRLSRHIASGDTTALAGAALRTLCMYNHYGYYQEASTFADLVLPHLSTLGGDDQETHWNYIGNVVQSQIASGNPERGLDILMSFAPAVLEDPGLLAKMHYMISMLHLRYLDTKDIDLSERHLLAALACLEQARPALKEHDYLFLNVFINNGMAFLRVRQGRRDEAVALCLNGYSLLTEAVGDEKHKLHRSVLLYNSAQVYMALGQPDEALKYYRESIAMDPHYSEYHNEMGNIFQREGKFDDALTAYDLAIKYSAPYPEVYFNKGVSHAQLAQWEEALAALDFSAELNPAQAELYLLRAEVHEALGHDEAALNDYSAALAAGSTSVVARVNRAVLLFQTGQFEQALFDMHKAIDQEPDNASHYENRAEIYRAMAQPALVSADLDAANRFREAA